MNELGRIFKAVLAVGMAAVSLGIATATPTQVQARASVATGDPVSADGTTSGGWAVQNMTVPITPALNAGYETGFGGAVDIDGDTMVVAATGDNGDANSTLASPNDLGGNFVGAVYVFVRVNGVWTPQALLKAPNGDPMDGFGTSVAIDGDTVVVGAYQEDGDSASTLASWNNNASEAGAAYVFARSGTTWTLQAYLKASDAAASNYFGRSSAVQGDTVLVGAYGAALNGGNKVYVYTRSGSTWTQQQILTPPALYGDKRFGWSLGISGDSMVIGAPYENGGMTSTLGSPNNYATRAGAAYVFVRESGTWTQQAYLKASNAEAQDYLGYEVSISGDTVIAGAYWEDGDASSTVASPNNNADKAGAVYVFVRNGTAWTQQAYLKPSNITANEIFGFNLSLLDSDTAVIVAQNKNGSITSTLASPNTVGAYGAAYVFKRAGSAWTESAMLKGPNTYSAERFGEGLAVDGNTLVIGVMNETDTLIACNSSRKQAGAALVYLLGVGDARLSNLELSSGTALTSTRDGGGFVPYNGCYAATVASDRTTVSPTTVAAGATTTATVSLLSGANGQTCAGMVCPLALGANLITVTVVSTDGLASRWYSVLTTRTASADADLTGIGTSVGEVAQKTSTAYTVTVPAGTTSVTLAPTTTHSAATAVASAPCSGLVCALSTFPTVVTLTVTAENGSTTKEYVVTFVRGVVPQQVSLSNLEIAPGSIAPAFVRSETGYVAQAPEGTTSVALTAPPDPVTATVTATTASGVCTGMVCTVAPSGQTLVTVTVTSQDRTVTKDYLVMVMTSRAAHLANVAKLGHGATANHFCLTTKDSGVLCWGANESGQLGTGDTVEMSLPVKMIGMADAVDVAMGKAQTCVLRSNGQVQCVGADDTGQLGNGSLGASATLTDVLLPDGSGPLTGVTHLAVGENAACAIVGGPVVCWGQMHAYWDGSAMVSVGSTLPLTVEGLTDAKQVGVGAKAACALRTNGEVGCWGSNSSNALGIGSASLISTTVPVTVLNVEGTGPLGNVARLRVGEYHTCVIQNGGGYYCWGANDYAQMGNGVTEGSSFLPTTATLTGSLTALTGITMTGPSMYHSCALAATGYVYCSGDNLSGVVGVGDTFERWHAMTVTQFARGPALSGQVDIGAIAEATCTMSDQGSVYCWGAGSNGKLGNGGTDDQYSPVWVIAALSDDARLNNLTINPGVLAPSFVSSTMDYAATVPNGTTSAAVTATVNDAKATVAYASSAGACAGAVVTCVVAAPKTWITATVTAEDGVTQAQYHIQITVADVNASDDARLNNLTINPGTLAPSFVSSTMDYAVTVLNGTTSAAVTATVSDAKATVAYASSAGSCDGAVANCAVAAPKTWITVTVTAADGVTIKEYFIEITVADANASTDASLANLTVAPGALAPAFVSSTHAYEAGMPNGMTSAAVTATPSDANATVTYESSAGACDAVGARPASPIAPTNCAVVAPKTWITVTVTAADGVTTEKYYIEVTVAAGLTTIDRVWPGTGLPEGGMPVQIFGTGFVAALTVTVGPYTDGLMIDVTFDPVSDKQIDFVMPAGVAGQRISVTVATAADAQTAPNAFTYVQPQMIEFNGLEGGVFTTTDGVVVEIPSQGVDGMFVITMTPLPPAPGVPGNILMYSFRLDALLNWVPLGSLTNPVTIKLPIDENIFAIADGERPWLYSWTADGRRLTAAETTDDGGRRSAVGGRWVLVRGQEYDPGTRLMTVALRPMGVYALSTAYLRAYWFPVVPVLR